MLEDPTIAGLFYRQATDNLHALKAAGRNISSKTLSELIVKGAELTATPNKKKRTGWLAENEEELLGLTDILKRASKQMRATKTHESILIFREARLNLRICKRQQRISGPNQ
jgi:hypothetical protein